MTSLPSLLAMCFKNEVLEELIRSKQTTYGANYLRAQVHSGNEHSIRRCNKETLLGAVNHGYKYLGLK